MIFGERYRSGATTQLDMRCTDSAFVKHIALGGRSDLDVGIGRVRDQLADEDFAVGVEGVDNDVEELFDLGLEFVLVRVGHGLGT